MEQELLGMWPHIRWVDFDSHGYIVVTVSHADVTAEWWAVEGVLERLPGEERTARFRVEHGRPRLLPVNEESVR